MENQDSKSLPSSSAADSPKTTLDATMLEIAMLGYETAIQLLGGGEPESNVKL
ncbi:hypothetical protein L0244_29485 [bacterium]|nr:hypothetical protein [bacterium]MCI0690767.1 hypothetical protein [candidate division KSB1 bacterium]